jgi:YfiH family protein
MEPFVLYSKDDPYLHLTLWEGLFPHLIVGMSTRTEENRNYALHVGDNPEQVIENREWLADKLHLPFRNWTCGEQVHGHHVELVKDDDRGRGKQDRVSAFANTDGLITDESDILLTSFYADCVPIFFYSPDINAVGVAHAGWKGTAQGIGNEMVKKFQMMGADIGQLQVVIAPSIGSCCYEVDDRVIDPLHEMLGSSLTSLIAMPIVQGHYRLDLKLANQAILLSTGLKHHQIIVSNRCTQCDDSLFFSHRRDGTRAGRMVAFIGKRGF